MNSANAGRESMMNNTSDSLDVCHALLLDDGQLRRRISASAVLSMISGKPVKVSVQMTSGRSLYVEINMRLSTPEESADGGTRLG